MHAFYIYLPTIWAISLESRGKPSILEADDFLGACCSKAMTPKKLWTLLLPTMLGTREKSVSGLRPEIEKEIAKEWIFAHAFFYSSIAMTPESIAWPFFLHVGPHSQNRCLSVFDFGYIGMLPDGRHFSVKPSTKGTEYHIVLYIAERPAKGCDFYSTPPKIFLRCFLRSFLRFSASSRSLYAPLKAPLTKA